MSFFKNALYLLSASVLTALLSFMLKPLVARFLGPNEYGLFALILGTATVIQAFTLLSMNSGVLYWTSKAPGRKKTIVGTVLSMSLAVSALIFFPLQFVIGLFAPALGFYSYAAAFFLSVGLSFFAVFQASLQGAEKFAEYSKYGVLLNFAAGALSVALAFYFHDGVLSAVARGFAILLIVIAALRHFRLLGGFERKTLSQVFDYSKPLAIAGMVAAFIAVVDRYFLAAFKGTAEVGYYDIGYAMVAAVLPFSGALLTIMMPRVIRQQQNLEMYYKKVAQANTIVLSCIGLFFFYYSDIIVTLLLGNEYAPAALPFKIIAFALPLMAFYGLNGASLDSVAKTKMSGLLAALLTLFSIAFNFFLVPQFGAAGAAYANLLTYIAVVAIGWYYLRSRRKVELRESVTQYALFFAFAVAYFAFLEKGGFVLKTLLFALFLAITLFTNRRLAKETLAQARNSLKK
ncbi:MAG TPA: flippase [Candidatus Norongarragalinales archaeon]|nr:flippase [Candidatus Norongarragalinales archaeon]